MKKLITFFIAFSLLSCNDGDFDVPSFEFSDDVNSCGETLLYRLSPDKTEVILLTLTNSELGTKVGEKSYAISSSLNIIYRIFDDVIDTNYFCQEIPPASPAVLKELQAENATIIINTTEIIENEIVTGYKYNISISELLFLDNNERIYFETFNFGEY
ncbi:MULTISPECIES: hypothetical protein [Flavobacteriaceae]|uniref:Uncharacterized protein n=2 Tax=Flavobacteriaceae TaxID=49546 RepID=A0A4Y8AWR2_9FLAO|nr:MULTISPECIES: hypothetical protein [Flavobacteriaceae]TEW76913.1 hypothetical protein E2488_03435 [Gramella jeungdoensis]GGK59338.1 hypothetical protein GCM10007963_29420 [Lutibacter litoralis]